MPYRMTIGRGTPLRSRLRLQTRLHRPVSPSLTGQLAAGPLYRCRQLLRRLSRAGWSPRALLMQLLVSPSHLGQLAASPLRRCRQLLKCLSRAGWGPLAPLCSEEQQTLEFMVEGFFCKNTFSIACLCFGFSLCLTSASRQVFPPAARRWVRGAPVVE